jgi:hypothetical protein
MLLRRLRVRQLHSAVAVVFALVAVLSPLMDALAFGLHDHLAGAESGAPTQSSAPGDPDLKAADPATCRCPSGLKQRPAGGRVVQDGHARELRECVLQDLELLANQLRPYAGHSGHVAANRGGANQAPDRLVKVPGAFSAGHTRHEALWGPLDKSVQNSAF